MGKIGPKIFAFAYEGADPPPYSQPDRKKTVFVATSLNFFLFKNQGVTRLSFMHYNTLDEVERVVEVIKAACSSW